MNQFKTSGSLSRCTLISKAGKFGKIDNNTFCKSDNGRKFKSRDVGSHKQHILALNDSLKHPTLIDQAADCGNFWKENDKVNSALSIIERYASILQVASKYKK